MADKNPYNQKDKTKYPLVNVFRILSNRTKQIDLATGKPMRKKPKTKWLLLYMYKPIKPDEQKQEYEQTNYIMPVWSAKLKEPGKAIEFKAVKLKENSVYEYKQPN